jgi:hypothetical protein
MNGTRRVSLLSPKALLASKYHALRSDLPVYFQGLFIIFRGPIDLTRQQLTKGLYLEGFNYGAEKTNFNYLYTQCQLLNLV